MLFYSYEPSQYNDLTKKPATWEEIKNKTSMDEVI